eukprot:Plantae.Rhodophyta-Purpureofilum_apyrenoidigerum.ctg4936.p1 GENE.Plantae.Rhodophyta-Purpureofilum_apyrenoidigerum.ctg4936~~Plantae.Rhodophyta-Purpureofilum_apyrenoidigerum.ctg4936.p1  ORF type:complete len:319 (-),score=59.70 Plantae.Rhodophyta-Purpureofilum_apyrenoidigerum.ctg4936:171-1127(-)
MGAGTEAAPELSKEEAAIFDRQIRLWGSNAQKQISESKVLCIGKVLSHIGNEVAKNVCLSGVGSIVLCQTEQPSDVGYLGVSLDEMATSLMKINKFCKVVAMEADASREEILEEAGTSRAVCTLGFRTPELTYDIASVARKNKSRFFIGGTFGLCGAVFLDLGEHEYDTEVPNEDDASKPGKTERKKASFVAYDLVFNKDGTLRSSHTPCASILAEILSRLLKEENAVMQDGSTDSFADSVLSRCAAVSAPKRMVPSADVLEEIGRCVAVDLPPVSAIVGGIYGREVVKAITAKDEPVKNFFFFDAIRSSGLVESLSG